MSISRLQQRVRVAELMDDPQLDPTLHRHALEGLSRLNRVSRSAAILWPALAALAQAGPIRVLDLASGSGDIPLAIWKKAQKSRLPIHVDGCDISPTALAVARQKAQSAGSDIEYFQIDVLREQWPGSYDVVTCSLFLHHLSDDEIVGLLHQAGRCARQMVLCNDLIRCRTGLFLAQIACRLLTRSHVVRVDGPRSVRAALTLSEIATLAHQAGLGNSSITTHWPCRFLLQAGPIAGANP